MPKPGPKPPSRPARRPLPCPVCRVPLKDVRYEGFWLRLCATCKGFLAERHVAEGIERRRIRTRAELESELKDLSRDSPGPLTCPRCRGEMGQRPLLPPLPTHLDHCDFCGLIWFDGGELAMFQLAYETSRKGAIRVDLQKRLQAMSPGRKAEFERNVRLLVGPGPDPGLLETVVTGLLDALYEIRSR